MRGALIGYGFIASQGHGPVYRERAKRQQHKQNVVSIIAIADICEARRAKARQDFPEARIYADYRSLLAAESGQLDFIDIATPPALHAEIAMAALEVGLHVLCEKPLTTSVEDARRLIDFAVAQKRVVFPCHNYKHAPTVKVIRAVIDSGVIGQVRSVSLNTFRNTHAKGVTEWHTHWRREHRFSGGGIAMDHGSHSFYLTFEWMKSYPTAVTAKMFNLDAAKYNTEDNFSCVLTFPTGIAQVNLSWTAGLRKVIYSIQGDRGGIIVDDDQVQVAVMRATSGPDVAQGAVAWDVTKKNIASHWMDASHVSWFNSMFDRFQAAVDSKDFLNTDLQEAFLCIQLIMTAYESAQNGSVEKPLLLFT